MRLRRRREDPCTCGHSQLVHMGLYGKCLAPLGNGSDVERRLSDLCYAVKGGCDSYRRTP